LVVDDDREIAEALCELLASEGFAVEAVSDGLAALRRMREPRPASIIVLDLMMPGMDGWEFLAQKKRDVQLAHVPVVVVSSDISAKARAVEADAFVPKPYRFDELLSVIEGLMQMIEGHADHARAARLDQLTSLGRLAAGVAHEINNPLTYVAGNLALLADELASGAMGDARLDEARELVRGALEGAERIGRIIGALKTFARPDDDRMSPVNVGAALDSAISLAGNELKHRARVVREGGAVPPVLAIPSRLGLLFLNLLLDAAQRLPEGQADGTELRVSVRASGPKVVVELCDLGRSLPRLRQLSDGLGMSICRHLAQEIGGQLQMECRQGGVLFRVILPAAQPAVAVAPAPSVPAIRRARMLVIDDEPRIGSVLQRALGREHDVVALQSARDALVRLNGGERFDLILCDMMMPEMTGMELFSELQQALPEVARGIVFLTGGAFTPRAQAFLDHVDNICLDKPLDLPRLRALVRERIGSPA
jgi:CheY-like chemotaxis protein